MGQLEVEVVTGLAGVDAGEWNRLEAGRSFYQSHPWLSWAEEEAGGGAVYLLARDARGRLVGAVAAYLMTGADSSWSSWYDPLTVVVGGPAGADGRRPCWFPTLLVGSRAGYHSDVVVGASLDPERRQAVVSALVRECRALVRPPQARSMAMMYVPAATARLARRAPCGPSSGVPVSANARISGPWRDFDAFLESLPRRRRANVQREIEAFRASGSEVVEARLSDCVEHVGPLLGNVHRKHGASDTDADTTRYLRSQMRHLDEVSTVFVELAGGDPVGFSLCYQWGNDLHVRVVGFDYERSARFAYFNLAYYLPVRHAIGHGLSSVHLGPGTYEAKVSRGAILDPTWAVVWPPDDDNAGWFDTVKRPGDDARQAARWLDHCSSASASSPSDELALPLAPVTNVTPTRPRSGSADQRGVRAARSASPSGTATH